VLNDIKLYSKIAEKDGKALVDRLMKANKSNQQKEADVFKSQIKDFKKRIYEIDNLVKKLFEQGKKLY